MSRFAIGRSDNRPRFLFFCYISGFYRANEWRVT